MRRRQTKVRRTFGKSATTWRQNKLEGCRLTTAQFLLEGVLLRVRGSVHDAQRLQRLNQIRYDRVPFDRGKRSQLDPRCGLLPLVRFRQQLRRERPSLRPLGLRIHHIQRVLVTHVPPNLRVVQLYQQSAEAQSFLNNLPSVQSVQSRLGK